MERASERVVGTEHPKVDGSLESHIEKILDYLQGKDNSSGYIITTEQRVRAVLRASPNLEAATVRDFLTQRVEEGLSKGSCNHYLRAAKMFTRYLERTRVISEDPLVGLSRLKNDKPKRKRRALTEEEFEKVLQTAHSSEKVRQGFDGPTRAMLYWVAGLTGFRASELASLTIESVNLDANSITCEAGNTKSKKSAAQPLPPGAMPILAEWVAGKTGPLFPGAWARRHRAAELLRFDLESAGIPYKDARGRYADFHALRVTYISRLARAGVSLLKAQRLARHCDPNLTANIYVDLGYSELADAVVGLPVNEFRKQ